MASRVSCLNDLKCITINNANCIVICSQFYEALQTCSQDPSKLGRMMKRYDRKLEMYYLYCKNKPQSDHIVSKYITYFDQIRQKLRHRLDVSLGAPDLVIFSAEFHSPFPIAAK